MATGQLNSLVRHLRRVVQRRSDGETTDRDLLKRFIARRDEDAFAALVDRYGPLVFGVCQRVLHHRQDAEDAFQATFLVLLHKAASITRPELLGNWLYGVAYYTAKNAKRRAARRRGRERQVNEMARRQPVGEEERLRELRSLLDEELSRLPEKYRVPIVLCELQGKSRKEVSLHLGCPEGTVSSRLTRGREMLRRRLIKRGLALGAGSLASVLPQDPASAAVPPLLVASTIKTVMLIVASQGPSAGTVSAHVAALTEAVLKSMLLAKLKIVTAILLTMSVMTGAGLLVHSALADKPAEPGTTPPRIAGKAADPAAKDRTRAVLAEGGRQWITVTGVVLGPEGGPVAGARLYLPHGLKEPPQTPDDVAVIQRGVTGDDGRFTLKLPRSDVPPRGAAAPAWLVAAADGFGLDWLELPQAGVPGDVVFHLAKDAPIRGRILTTEGKPIAGVSVHVGAIMVPAKLDDFLKALQREWRAAETMMKKQLTLPVTKVLRVTVSDKDGRFEIAGTGVDRLVGVEVINANLVRTHFLVVTHEGFDAKAMNEAIAKTGRGAAVCYGPSFDHISEPSRPIDGTVREAGTGKPVVGATVQAMGNAGASAITSDGGRYHISGVRKAQQYTLSVTPPPNMPLVGRSVSLSDASSLLDPIHADVNLLHGVIVTGRVYDKATGKAVQSSVRFVPSPDNKFAKNALDGLSLYAWTDAEGRFRLVTIPGPGVLLADVLGTRETVNGVRLHPYPINRYKAAEFSAADRKRVKLPDEVLQYSNAYNVLDIKEGGDVVSCDLVVDAGKTLAVNIEDPDGKPLTGAIVSGATVMSLGAISVQDAACTVYALDPAKPRQLVLLHQERQLAGVLTLRGDEKQPLTVRLGPTGTMTGRLLDQDGQPISGANVAVLYTGQMGSDLARELRRRYDLPRTDVQGCFRLEGIVPNLKFDLGFIKGRQRLEPTLRLEIEALKPGGAVAMGDIRVKPQ